MERLTTREQTVLKRLHELEQNLDHHIGHGVQPQEINIPGTPAGHTLKALLDKGLAERRRIKNQRVYLWNTTRLGLKALARKEPCPRCNDEGWIDDGSDINGDLVICPAPCAAGKRELAKVRIHSVAQ